MPTKAKELTSCEVQLLAVDIARVLEQCPRYNLIEVLECAADTLKKDKKFILQ